tara:strand:+ start:131 stop:598 length:468 start_codon:yes stop_codon:yes gene_type:complete
MKTWGIGIVVSLIMLCAIGCTQSTGEEISKLRNEIKGLNTKISDLETHLHTIQTQITDAKAAIQKHEDNTPHLDSAISRIMKGERPKNDVEIYVKLVNDDHAYIKKLGTNLETLTKRFEVEIASAEKLHFAHSCMNRLTGNGISDYQRCFKNNNR